MSLNELRDFLNEKYLQYNSPFFIESDPIQIPHKFELKQDVEIAGLLTATIAWGNRKSIIKNANRIMALMEEQPYDFILNASPADLKKLQGFCHRTFQDIDLIFFIQSLKNIYQIHGGLQKVFSEGFNNGDAYSALDYFRKVFLEPEHLKRTEKHVSSVAKGASAKRLNMYLRWMVRDSNRGVDFGVWNDIPTSELMMPLDIHSGNVARKLGLLDRKQNDWKAVCELTENLKEFDPTDPVKYDFALFGLGAFEKF